MTESVTYEPAARFCGPYFPRRPPAGQPDAFKEGRLTEVDTFRIGNIGRLFAQDIQQLALAIGAVCRDMGIFPVDAFAT